MAKQFQQGAIEQDENFGQNAKQNKIREKETRMIYLCSTEGKRLADGCKLHHLPAFVLPVLLPERGQGVGLTPSSPSQRYNTLDFGSKVVCHETPARFLWILPAQRAGAAGRAAVKIQIGPAAALPRSAPQQYRPPTQRLVLHQPRSNMLSSTPAHPI